MKAVLFDLGNVLVHYDHTQTIAGVAQICSAPVDDVRRILGEVQFDIETGRLSEEGFHAYLRAHAGAGDDQGAFAAAFNSGITRNESALAYAVELEQREGVVVAVISNTTETHAAWLDENVPELREFDLVMMSNEVGMRKPDPAIFRLALELLDVRPEEAIFFDDIAENVTGAQSLGIAGFVHTSWTESRPHLEAWLAA